LCKCALDWSSLSPSLSFVAPFTVCIIIDYRYHSSCWLLHLLILSLFIAVTLLLLLDYYYQSPTYSLLHTCLVLIVFFSFIILFNTFVGLIHLSFIILSFHYSPHYCSTWDSI
jgi:hypothetical protein